MELYLYFDFRSNIATTTIINREKILKLEVIYVPGLSVTKLFFPTNTIPIRDGFISIDPVRMKCIRKTPDGVFLENIDTKFYAKLPFRFLNHDILDKNINTYDSYFTLDGRKIFVTNWYDKNILLNLEQQTIRDTKITLISTVLMTSNLLICKDYRGEINFHELERGNFLPIYLAPQGINFQNFTLEKALSPHYLEKAYRLHKWKDIKYKGKNIHDHQQYFHIFKPSDREEKGLILIPYRDAMICYHCRRFSIIPDNSIYVHDSGIAHPFIHRSSVTWENRHLSVSNGSAYQLCPRPYLRTIIVVYRMISKIFREQKYYDPDVCDLIFLRVYPIFTYENMNLFRNYLDGKISLKEMFPRL